MIFYIQVLAMKHWGAGVLKYLWGKGELSARNVHIQVLALGTGALGYLEGMGKV